MRTLLRRTVMLQIYLPPTISLPVATPAQQQNAATGQNKKIETEMEVEHLFGAYHDLREGGISPVVGLSGTVDFWRGRVSHYVSFERAFTAPTLTYYHGESAVVLVNAKRWQVMTGVLSRTIQPIGAKVALQIKEFQVYGTTGRGAHSFGLVLNF